MENIGAKERYGVITFLDVLGWKGVWQRKNEAIGDLESIVKAIKNKAKTKERGIQTTDRIISKETTVMIVSDTIVLFTEADFDNAKDKIELHGELCAEAIPLSIKKGLPLRGATSFGEVIISDSNNIFAGKAIDEAASWHEKAEWIGVYLTPSANFLFSSNLSKFWIEYTPPLKDKALNYQTHSVVWFSKETIDEFINEVKKDFTQLAPIFPEIVSKFTNTIDYIKEFKNK